VCLRGSRWIRLTYCSTRICTTYWLGEDHGYTIRVSAKGQPTSVAHISSNATNERLYAAIIRLPQVSSSPQLSPTARPEYQLVFKAARDAPATIYLNEKFILFDNNYWCKITDQFEQVFKETLAKATFSPT
jgi:hypothetical protein